MTNYRKPRLIIIPPQHLGHELHVSRSIICDMIKRKFITPDLGDSVFTGLPDRKFFYESLFGAERVFDFTELSEFSHLTRPPKNLAEYVNVNSEYFSNLIPFSGFDIINLNNYAAPPTYCVYTANEEMRSIGYDIPPNYFDNEFKNISKNFKFSDHNEINQIAPISNNLFIVIHHRYGSSVDNLAKLFLKFPTDLLKIIFTSDSANLISKFREFENIKFIDNLQIYASLLKDFRCKLLISEWSGGGQISQYTLGEQGVVWYYYDHYPDLYNFTMTHKIWELNATLGTYFNCWDFKCVSGCNIRHFKNIESLIYSK